MSWVISALSGPCIPGNDRFHHFHGTDPGTQRWSAGSICAEHQYYQSTVDLHCRKYYSGSVHPAADHTDL